MMTDIIPRWDPANVQTPLGADPDLDARYRKMRAQPDKLPAPVRSPGLVVFFAVVVALIFFVVTWGAA